MKLPISTPTLAIAKNYTDTKTLNHKAIKVFDYKPTISDIADGEIGLYEYENVSDVKFSYSTSSAPTSGHVSAAFNRDNVTYVFMTPGSTWIKISYEKPHVVSELKMYGKNATSCLNAFKLQASNDDENWTDLVTDSLVNNDTLQTFAVVCTMPYQYYRITEVSNHGSGSTIQHRDIRLNPATIPIYTQSVAGTSSGNNASATLVFDNDGSTNFSASTAPRWVKVEFPTAIVVRRMVCTSVNLTTQTNAFKLQGSNDDTNWVDLIADNLLKAEATNTFDTDNVDAYKYYKFLEVSNHGAGNAAIYGIKLYV